MNLLGGPGWAVIVGYFALIFGVALWAGLRERSSEGAPADYFFSGRDAG